MTVEMRHVTRDTSLLTPLLDIKGYPAMYLRVAIALAGIEELDS